MVYFVSLSGLSSYVCMCFMLLQHGADYRQEVPPLTLTSSKAGATLAVSEQWLQKLEKLYQAESSTSTESPPESGSGCRLASGNALLHWVFDWEPVSPCTPTLPGEDTQW